MDDVSCTYIVKGALSLLSVCVQESENIHSQQRVRMKEMTVERNKSASMTHTEKKREWEDDDRFNFALHPRYRSLVSPSHSLFPSTFHHLHYTLLCILDCHWERKREKESESKKYRWQGSQKKWTLQVTSATRGMREWITREKSERGWHMHRERDGGEEHRVTVNDSASLIVVNLKKTLNVRYLKYAC